MNKVIAFGNRFWDRLIVLLQNSVIGRFILWICESCRRMFGRSVIFQTLRSPKIYDMAEGSLLGNLFRGLFSVFQKAGEKIGSRLVRKSCILQTASLLFRRIAAITFRGVGCGLIFCAPGFFVAGYRVISIALLLCGALCALLPGGVVPAVCNSFLFRLLTGIREAPPYAVSKKQMLGQCLIGGSAGIIFSGVTYFFGLMPACLIAFGLIGGCAVLARPELGIFACVFCAPFLPTMLLAAMLGGTFLCFVLQLLAGNKKYAFHLDTTGIFLLAFAGILLFFGATSFTPGESIKIALLECLFIMSYFLITFLIDSKKKLVQMVFLYCLSSLFTGFIGLYQYLSGYVDTTWTDTQLFEGLKMRVYSTFENPNVYGEYLLLCVPMAVVMIFLAKRPIMKLFYAGTSAVLLVNLALTYARGCYLAILLSIAVVICFGAKRLIALGAVGLCALPFVLPQSILSRFASITNLADSSTSYRLNIWKGTLRMLEDFWLFGTGLGQTAYNTAYPLYSLSAIFAPHAHSLYLQVLSEMGIAGFLLLCAFCIASLCTAYQAYQRSKGTKTMWFVLAMMAAIIGFLFEGIFEYVWYNYRVFLLFFITLGIVSALCRQILKEGELAFD